jgi:glycosyltransferase involved in cell wall biosynthesis
MADELVGSGAAVTTLSKPGASILTAFFPLRRLVTDKQIAVVHSQIGAAGLLARLALLGSDSVATVYTEQNIPGGYHRLGRALNCLTLSLPDVLVVSSLNILDSWRHCRRSSKQETARIPNGIDIPPWPAPSDGRRRWRQLFRASDDELVIGTIGHCHERKGQGYLIEACRGLLTALRARLVIVGDGPLRPWLQEMAKNLGISDRVTFTGMQADIPGLIASFDIFALPSIAEGMPIVLLEAMVRGLPSVATSVGANPDVIRDGESGLLVQPKAVHELREALETLAGSEALRERLGIAARQRIVGEFSVGRMCKEYEVLYEAVASRRRVIPA